MTSTNPRSLVLFPEELGEIPTLENQDAAKLQDLGFPAEAIPDTVRCLWIASKKLHTLPHREQSLFDAIYPFVYRSGAHPAKRDATHVQPLSRYLYAVPPEVLHRMHALRYVFQGFELRAPTETGAANYLLGLPWVGARVVLARWNTSIPAIHEEDWEVAARYRERLPEAQWAVHGVQMVTQTFSLIGGIAGGFAWIAAAGFTRAPILVDGPWPLIFIMAAGGLLGGAISNLWAKARKSAKLLADARWRTEHPRVASVFPPL